MSILEYLKFRVERYKKVLLGTPHGTQKFNYLVRKINETNEMIKSYND